MSSTFSQMYSYYTLSHNFKWFAMAGNEERLMLMKKGPVPSSLLRLGLPTMVGMVVSALYNVVDAYFVGGLGPSQMGAVSISFPIAQVIIGLGMTFGTGAASYLSRLLGRDERQRAGQVASTALYSGLAVGTVAIGIALCCLDSLLRALGATDTILPYARQYAIIYIAGSILNVFTVEMNNIVTSEGATKVSMCAMLLSCGLNILFAPLFIYTFKLGIAGAAIATVAAQAVASIMYLVHIARHKSVFSFSISDVRVDGETFTEIMKIGVPTLVVQLLTSVAIGLTNRAAGAYGDEAVAAMGIVTRLLTLGSYVIFGFMKGFQPFIGFNYGAKVYKRVRRAIGVSIAGSTAFCVLVSILMFIFPEQIMRLFSAGTESVIAIGGDALRAEALPFAFFGFQMLIGVIYLAFGKGLVGGIMSIARQGLFFLPLIVILPNELGLRGIILAQPIADALSTVLAGIFALRLRKELRGLR
jgi:putative MATE family efflux protein